LKVTFPNLIEGNLGKSLIRAYQNGRAQTMYLPDSSGLAMVCQDPLPFLPVITDAPWQIIDKKKRRKKLKLRLQLRSNPQIFSLDLLQLKPVSL